MAELAAGSTFAGYRIEELAGRGGMGVVYRATQLALDRPAALKLIKPEFADDDSFRDRFKRESRIAASIDHVNVIPVYEAGEAEKQLFITMRYVDGTDLSGLIQREGRLELERAITVVEQIASALDAAHKRGLVHRDVKPANVLISEDGHVYLTDFGLTKYATSVSGVTKTGQFIGTLDYVAPEQIEGKKPDARADIYALGCVLYHALTGRRPYERDNDVATMYAQLSHPAPSVTAAVPDAPAALDDVIARAMAKDPAERFPSAGDFARVARQALDSTVVVPPERSVAAGSAAPGPASEAPTAPPESGPAVLGDADATVPPGGMTIPPGGSPSSLAGGRTVAPAADASTKAPAADASTKVPAAVPPPRAVAKPALPGADARAREQAPSARARTPMFALAGVGLVALAGLAALVVWLVLPALSGGGGGEERVPAASIAVGKSPDGIVIGGGSVWVSNSQDDTITRIDPESNQVAGSPIAVGANPDGILYADGAVWVADTDDGSVSRVEPGGGDASAITVGLQPIGLALADVNVWVTNSGDDTVTRIDRESQVARPPPIQVGDQPVGIYVGPESVWVTNLADGTVSRIGRNTNEILQKPIPVGSEPRGVVEAEGAVWVVNQGDDTVSRIDPTPGRLAGDPIPVGATPKEIAFAGGLLWVTNEGDGTVTRIDPGTGAVVGDPVKVGDSPRGIAFGEGAVWVANSGDNTITRIDLAGSRP